MLAHTQINAYYKILENLGIRLENIISWFFSDYLINEFHAPHFRVTMPSAKTTYAEKCTLMLAAMESLIRQYRLYTKNGEIDFDLLQLDATFVKYPNIPSILSPKYAYGQGDDYKAITYYLFSEQSLLTFIKRIPITYSTLYDLLQKETVYLSDYDQRDITRLNWLAEKHILKFDKNQKIYFDNLNTIDIFYDLYRNEVININRYPIEVREKIFQLADENYLEFEDTLLSKPESALFNYYLNKAEFINGLDLRNGYMHGVKQTIVDEKHHEFNYFIILRLFIDLIIKINDEFCLKDLWQKQLEHKE